MPSTSPPKRPALSNRVSQLISSFNDQESHTESQPPAKPPQSRTDKDDSKRYQGQWSFHESPDLHRQSSARIGLGGFLGFSNSKSSPSEAKGDTRKVDNGLKHRKKSSPNGSSRSRSTKGAEPELDHEIPLVTEASNHADSANAGLKPNSSEAPIPATPSAHISESGSKTRKSPKSKHHRTSSQPTIAVEDTDNKPQQDHPRGRKPHKSSPSRVQTRSKPKPSQSKSTDPKRPRTSDGTTPKPPSWNMFNLFPSASAPHAQQRSKSQDPTTSKGNHARKVSGDLRPQQTRHRRNLSAPNVERERGKIYSRKDSSGRVTIHVDRHEGVKHLDDLERSDWRAGLAHRVVGDLY